MGTTDNRQRTTAKMERKIENLKIWNDSRAFVNEIYKMMAQCCDYGFRDQIQRASVSIMNNMQKDLKVVVMLLLSGIFKLRREVVLK